MSTFTPAEAAACGRLVELALAEDLGNAGDRTSVATIPEGATGKAAFVARTAGVLLDPVYTAKAFLALLSEARRDRGRFGRRVLFVHTGGGFGVFPYRAPLTRLLDGELPPDT